MSVSGRRIPNGFFAGIRLPVASKWIDMEKNGYGIAVDASRCIRCGRCVQVCPAQIFEQEDGGGIAVRNPESCIVCGHCAAACPSGAVRHAEFPSEKVHPVDRRSLPAAEQVLALCRARRSNRALTAEPVPEEALSQILEAAHCAPTASNKQQVAFTVVTDPAALRRISEFTLGVFDRIRARLTHPLIRPWLRRLKPEFYRYLPAFERLRREYDAGRDRILRGATAAVFIHLPRENRFGAEDANLAYQNASLMAEALGVSQIYMGFVLTAVRQDRSGALNRLLEIGDRRICAVMALGMPQFRYPNRIDRKELQVDRI